MRPAETAVSSAFGATKFARDLIQLNRESRPARGGVCDMSQFRAWTGSGRRRNGRAGTGRSSPATTRYRPIGPRGTSYGREPSRPGPISSTAGPPRSMGRQSGRRPAGRATLSTGAPRGSPLAASRAADRDHDPARRVIRPTSWRASRPRGEAWRRFAERITVMRSRLGFSSNPVVNEDHAHAIGGQAGEESERRSRVTTSSAEVACRDKDARLRSRARTMQTHAGVAEGRGHPWR